MRFKLVFKDGLKTVATVEGARDAVGDTTIADILFMEAKFEQLLGLRLHIEQAKEALDEE